MTVDIRTSIIKPKRVEYRYRLKGWVYRKVDEERVIHSMFDEADLAAFEANGFLLVEDVYDATFVSEMRAAMDTLRRADFGDSQEAGNPPDAAVNGQYLADAVTRDRTLARLLDSDGLVDSVRSLLGPAIALRASCGRVTFPGKALTEACWHVDFRLDVTPRPPLAATTPVVSCIVYLDDANLASGPIAVVPGSHDSKQAVEIGGYGENLGGLMLKQMGLEPGPRDEPANLPGSVVLTPRAGSVLFFPASLWHRVPPNPPSGSLRRVMLLQFAEASVRRAFLPVQAPKAGSVEEQLLTEADTAGDAAKLELLGRGPNWY